MKKVIVVAPHPDDETLGGGGTLLRHKEQGDELNWLIVTDITQEADLYIKKLYSREKEIEKVANMYGFKSVYNLKWPTTRLDALPMADIVDSIGSVFKEVRPEIVYLPYPGDIHTDHKVVFNAVASCTKWFRFDSVKRVLAYETLSETDFAINPHDNCFCPNVFIDISKYLETKIEIMKVYADELNGFPFPRSEQAIRALAALRGAAAGCRSAEGFMLLKEIITP